MKPNLVLLLSVMTGTVPVMACLNGSHAIERVVIKKLPAIPLDAPPVTMHPHGLVKIEAPAFNSLTLPAVSTGLSDEQKKIFEKIIHEFEASDRSKASFEQTTDYAIALIYIGRYAEAIHVLKEVEKTTPGSYVTASALGTAYELNGDLKNAREWIALGMVRDANSHEGTEWLHIAIIDAKIQLKADSKWLAKHSTIQSRDGKTPASILQAIEYQLKERLTFVSGEDAIVSDLFYQAALLSDGFIKKDYYFQQSLRFGKIRQKEIHDARSRFRS